MTLPSRTLRFRANTLRQQSDIRIVLRPEIWKHASSAQICISTLYAGDTEPCKG